MAKHDHENLFRYLDGDLTDAEKLEMGSHLKDCRECTEFLSFISGLKSVLKKMTPEQLSPDTPCPDSETLVAFSAGQLDERETQLVRTHAVFCKECLDELALLRQTTESAGIRFAEASWPELLERMKQFVIDLGKSYGIGALIGPVQILAEQPALAVRGGGTSTSTSKVLEVSVGENTYSVEVAATNDGSLSFDIAGVAYRVKVPLNISLQTEAGDELISSKTDKFGNGHLAVPPVPGKFIVIKLDLQGDVRQILLRVPESKEPA
jgi:hypothetical protein